jgi:hypothetical protein
MNSYFEKLGHTVLERWRQQNFSLEVFPQLARAAIDEAPPSASVDMQELIHEFLSNDEQPFQSESGFGQPELIAFNDTRFYIQLLFWMEGTTEIHQHEFSGAFHVMQGSSVHSEFDFVGARSVTPHIRVGNLHVKQVELLETGSTIPITSGRACIHSLFHLDTPSVTLVIRTHHDPGTGPQYNYLPPYIAINPLHSDPLTARRKQLIDVLETTHDPNYATYINEMLERLDFERGFNMLRHAMPYLKEIDEWDVILTTFQQKHGELAMGVHATLTESLRRETITQMRHFIVNPEHRFFLALLMNVQNRTDILALINKRFSDSSPIETILGWAEELIEPNDFGITLLDAVFPETLDIDIEEQSHLFIVALKHALEGNADGELTEIQTALTNSCLRPLFS